MVDTCMDMVVVEALNRVCASLADMDNYYASYLMVMHVFGLLVVVIMALYY
jgi:hypothetical protein